MAANEFEAFQVFIQAPPSTELRGFRLGVLSLKDSAGRAFTDVGGRLSIFREELASVEIPSGPDGGTGSWPDALIPAFDEVYGLQRNAFDRVPAFVGGTPVELDIPAGQWRVYWVEVYAPQGWTSTFSGYLRASWRASRLSDGVEVAVQHDIPLTVVPNGLALPSTSSLRNYYQTGWTSFCRYLIPGDNGACAGAGLEDLQDVFTGYMLSHRLSARLGWVGAREPRNLGLFEMRYAPFLNGTASDAPRASDGARMVALPKARLTSFIFEPEWPIGLRERDPDLYYTWRTFMKSRGWHDRTFDYTCDEPGNPNSSCPDPTVIPERELTVHSGDPELPTLVTASPGHLSTYRQDINLVVANTTFVHSALDADSRFLDLVVPRPPSGILSGVHEAWWYQACDVHGCLDNADVFNVGSPSLMIDVGCESFECANSASATQNRAQQWLTYYYGFSGELYYEWMGYDGRSNADPYIGVAAHGGNGDGMLVYPWSAERVGGRSDRKIPVPSLRLKILRDGMEDYEYLRQLAALCPRDADAFVESLFGMPVSTTRARISPEDFLATRDAVATRIVRLRSGAEQCPEDLGATCPSTRRIDCCGDGSVCMSIASKCDYVQCQ